MLDAVNAKNIPVDTPIVGGYINGRYRWSEADWERFPNSKLIRIAVYIPGQTPPNDGDVLDVEAGDAPTRGAQEAIDWWVPRRQEAGIVPTEYTSKSTLHYVARGGCDYWLAEYTHENHLIEGSCATQWDSYEDLGYDISETAVWWPRSKDGKTVPNAPCSGIKLTPDGKGYWLWGEDGGLFSYHEQQPINFGNPSKDLPPGDKIIGFDCTPTGQGYVFASAQYNTYSYGDAPVLGHP
jgi:hypothetical protein